MKVFVDTNVLIAAFLEEHIHHERAWPIVDAVQNGRDLGLTSSHAVLETYSTLTRMPRSPRLLSHQAAAIIEENILSKFTSVALTAKEYTELVLRLGKSGIGGGQAYDALHLACAQKAGAERIYTFNVRHFQTIAPDSIRNLILPP